MKIVFTAQTFLPAPLTGSGKFVEYASRELSKKGLDITIITSNALEGLAFYSPFAKKTAVQNENMGGARVIRLNTNPFFSSTAFILSRYAHRLLPKSARERLAVLSWGPDLPNLEQAILAEKPDLIHASPFPAALVYKSFLISKKHKIPLVCTPFFHTEIPIYQNRLLEEILQGSSLITVCTPSEKEKIQSLGVPDQKIKIIPMGIDPAEWATAKGQKFKDQYHLNGKKIVLFAGIKGAPKGVVHLLKAMENVQSKIKDTILVAMGPDMKDWISAKKCYPQLNLIDLGYISESDKRDVFDACDILVLPSISESFGIVYIEAWLRKKAVIGANIPAVRDMISDGKDGLLVEFGDCEGLAKAIHYLLTHEEQSNTMGLEGYQKVMDRFLWENSIQTLHNEYQKLLNHNLS